MAKTAGTRRRPGSNGDFQVEEIVPEEVVIEPFAPQHIEITVRGVTELITHRWSEKAKKEIADRQQGRSQKGKKAREKRDPKAEYEAAFYRMPDGRPAVRASAFKAAIVGACRFFDVPSMVVAKIAIRVEGDLVPVEGGPHMREDMVRIGMGGTADIRYRPGFPEWKCTLPITFISNAVTLEQLINLIQAAGFGGIGEWRPSAPKSSTGTFGCFEVVPDDNV